jgi:hypothetical protein
MAFETKVLISLIARHIAKADSLEEAYEAVMEAANVEGMDLPSYEAMLVKLKKKKQDDETK